jgi:hypothetical protein
LYWKVLADYRVGGIDSHPQESQTAPVGSIAWFEEQDKMRARRMDVNDGVDFGPNVLLARRTTVLGSGVSRFGRF